MGHPPAANVRKKNVKKEKGMEHWYGSPESSLLPTASSTN